MKSFRTILFVFSLLLMPAFFSELNAQTPNPTPKKDAQRIFDEDEVISVNTALVDIPVSVFDKNGRVLPKLGKEDFRIYENGVEQKIESFASVEQPFTVVMLLDVSGSMRIHLDDIKKAALAFIENLKPTDRVIAIAFDSQIRVLSTDVLNREKLRKAIKDMQPGSRTFLYSSVELVSTKLLRRFPGRKALLLFTDGADSWTSKDSDGKMPRATYKSSLSEAEVSGALIYCVQFYPVSGKENERANKYLAELAEAGGGRLFRPQKVKELQPAFVSIAEDLRWQYSIGYYPEKPAQPNERRQIKVVVSQPEASVRARESYVGKP
jgi:Ca-activated chloride channel homolog